MTVDAPKVEYRCIHAVAEAPILALVRCAHGCVMWVREEPVCPLPEPLVLR